MGRSFKAVSKASLRTLRRIRLPEINVARFELGTDPVATLVAAREHDRRSPRPEELGDTQGHRAIDVEVENGQVHIAALRGLGGSGERIDDLNLLHPQRGEDILGVERDQVLVLQQQNGQAV